MVHLSPGCFGLWGPIIFCTIGHRSHAWENLKVRFTDLIIFIWSFNVYLLQALGIIKPEEPKIFLLCVLWVPVVKDFYYLLKMQRSLKVRGITCRGLGNLQRYDPLSVKVCQVLVKGLHIVLILALLYVFPDHGGLVRIPDAFRDGDGIDHHLGR
jgi:hypothetical protein